MLRVFEVKNYMSGKGIKEKAYLIKDGKKEP